MFSSSKARACLSMPNIFWLKSGFQTTRRDSCEYDDDTKIIQPDDDELVVLVIRSDDAISIVTYVFVVLLWPCDNLLFDLPGIFL